jgi:hypothetical protein
LNGDLAILPSHAQTSDGVIHQIISWDKEEEGIIWILHGLGQYSVPADKVVFYFKENMKETS